MGKEEPIDIKNTRKTVQDNIVKDLILPNPHKLSKISKKLNKLRRLRLRKRHKKVKQHSNPSFQHDFSISSPQVSKNQKAWNSKSLTTPIKELEPNKKRIQHIQSHSHQLKVQSNSLTPKIEKEQIIAMVIKIQNELKKFIQKIMNVWFPTNNQTEIQSTLSSKEIQH